MCICPTLRKINLSKRTKKTKARASSAARTGPASHESMEALHRSLRDSLAWKLKNTPPDKIRAGYLGVVRGFLRDNHIGPGDDPASAEIMQALWIACAAVLLREITTPAGGRLKATILDTARGFLHDNNILVGGGLDGLVDGLKTLKADMRYPF